MGSHDRDFGGYDSAGQNLPEHRVWLLPIFVLLPWLLPSFCFFLLPHKFFIKRSASKDFFLLEEATPFSTIASITLSKTQTTTHIYKAELSDSLTSIHRSFYLWTGSSYLPRQALLSILTNQPQSRSRATTTPPSRLATYHTFCLFLQARPSSS